MHATVPELIDAYEQAPTPDFAYRWPLEGIIFAIIIEM